MKKIFNVYFINILLIAVSLSCIILASIRLFIPCIILLAAVLTLAVLSAVIFSKETDKYKSKTELFEKTSCALREGLVILDGEGNVFFANTSAVKLLEFDEKSEVNLLDDNISPAIRDLIARAKRGKRAEGSMLFEGIEYELSADPVFNKGTVEGIAFLILKESEKEKSQLIRREFTANVSHELKTPLHAISGYAELLKNGMVKEEDKERFLSNIYSEAQRLVDLIDDTIKLSRLDEGARDMEREKLDLFALAEKTLSLLDTKAKRAGIALSLSGKESFMNGIPQLLEGIIFNLVDNAIKYNRENGSVSVEIKETPKKYPRAFAKIKKNPL